jgi:hypothetical protein
MMNKECDIKPRFCSEEIFRMIMKLYDDHVMSSNLSFCQAIERFEDISERSIRPDSVLVGVLIKCGDRVKDLYMNMLYAKL